MPTLRNIKHSKKTILPLSTSKNGYVERVSRGVYKITQKGEKLLEILT